MLEGIIRMLLTIAIGVPVAGIVLVLTARLMLWIAEHLPD